MKIEYLGHSCFLFEDEKGVRLLTDPYDGVGFPLPRVSADIVTVSHNHFDHNHIGGVDGNPTVLDKGGTFRVKGLSVEGVPCFHDGVQGRLRGKNLIFKFCFDGISVAHLGDLGERPYDALVATLRGTDVMLIPVGGNYTIDARTAKEYVGLVKPSVVIPMHYKTAGLTIDISSAEGFLGLFTSEKDVQIVRGGNSVTLSRSDLGSSKTKILVLERKKA